MDDGWCFTCQETTDGNCIHFDDGSVVHNAYDEIIELRNKIIELSGLLDTANEDVCDYKRMLRKQGERLGKALNRIKVLEDT